MKVAILLGLFLLASPAAVSFGQDFRKWEKQIAEYKQWLDALGPQGGRYWMRVESKSRPHKLYVAKAFFDSDFDTQKRFIETFSSYLAGHPEKLVLMDLFDATTKKPVGELGWDGFKLYPQPGRTARAQATRNGAVQRKQPAK